jgi:cytidylate kinase
MNYEYVGLGKGGNYVRILRLQSQALLASDIDFRGSLGHDDQRRCSTSSHVEVLANLVSDRWIGGVIGKLRQLQDACEAIKEAIEHLFIRLGPDMSFQIALDGPVAAGKGTVARMVADKLGFLYIDTGAMYRATALAAKEQGMDLSDEKKVAQVAKSADIVLRKPTNSELDGRPITVLLNGKDVSWEIRKPEFSELSSQVGKLLSVRVELVKKQQAMAKNQSVVMEGRDICEVVIPNANLKLYLDATPEVRAKRRLIDLNNQEKKNNTNIVHTYEEVLAALKARDDADMHRANSPLKVAEGAVRIDTTNLTIEQVVEVIVRKVKNIQK